MATIDILGCPHAYTLSQTVPSGATVVLIHGWLLSQVYWQPLIDLLSADYQCLAYDLRGFGRSQPERRTAIAYESYSLAAYAKDLIVLLKELNISDAWLVGHSLGGSVALWAADLLPQRIRGVICVNAGGGIYLKEEFERFRAVGQQLVRLRSRWLCYVPWLDGLFRRASVARAIAPEWGKQRLLDFVSADAAAALGTLLESTTEPEVHRLPQIVSRLQQPVYFIAGVQDPIMELKYVRHLASFHALFQGYGANVIEIDQCGHLAMVEHPVTVAQQIRHILTQHQLHSEADRHNDE